MSQEANQKASSHELGQALLNPSNDLSSPRDSSEYQPGQDYKSGQYPDLEQSEENSQLFIEEGSKSMQSQKKQELIIENYDSDKQKTKLEGADSNDDDINQKLLGSDQANPDAAAAQQTIMKSLGQNDEKDENDRKSEEPIDEDERIEENINELLDQLGGFNKFQIFAYIAIIVGMDGPNWFCYSIGYLIQKPDVYLCTYTDGITPPEDICTVENICDGDPRIASWEADPNDSQTLNNWQQQLDLTCVPNWKVGMIGGSTFLGWSLTLLWLPRLADQYGRKKQFWGCVILDQVLYTIILFNKSLDVMIAASFLFGCLTSIRAETGYMYICEMMPYKNLNQVITFWYLETVVIYLLATIYFWKTDASWFWFVLIGYVWNIISMVCLYWMPESPRYLISANKLKLAKQAFQTIANFNGRQLDWQEHKFIKNYDTSKVKTENQSLVIKQSDDDVKDLDIPNQLQEDDDQIQGPEYSSMYYLKQTTILVNLSLMSMIQLTTNFGYYLLLTLVSSFENIYTSALVASAAQFLGYLLAGMIVGTLGIKRSLVMSFALSTIGGTLITAWGINNQESPWFQVLLFITQLGIAFAANTNAILYSFIFPTLFAATALGISAFAAKLFSITSFFITYIAEPYPMLILTFLTGACFLGSFFLMIKKVEKNKKSNTTTDEALAESK